MSTDTATKNLEEEVDLESFMDAEKQEEDTESGMVRLTSVERISDSEDIPGYYEHYHTDYEKDVLVFTGKKVRTDEEIEIAVSEDENSRDWEFLTEWIDEETVSSMAGRRVPIEQLSNGRYKIATFEQTFLSAYEPAEIKRMVDMGAAEYEDGAWTKSDKMRRQEEFLQSVEDYTELGFFVSLVGLFVFAGPFVTILFSFAAAAFFVTSVVAASRNRPFEPVIKRA